MFETINKSSLLAHPSERGILGELYKNFDSFQKDFWDIYDIPTVEMEENPDGDYELKVKFAGYDKADIEITLHGNIITVVGNNEEFGKKVYSVRIPESEVNVKSVKSKLINGILYIVFKPLEEDDIKIRIRVE